MHLIVGPLTGGRRYAQVSANCELYNYALDLGSKLKKEATLKSAGFAVAKELVTIITRPWVA